MATADVLRKVRIRPLRRRPAAAGRPARAEAAELTAGVAIARWMLAGLSLLAIWCLAFTLLFSRLAEHREQRSLYAEFREKLALQTARIGADANGDPIPMGEPVAILDAPAAGLANLVVVEGTTSAVTRSGPGHRRDTPLPGQAGASKIYGRSVTFGAPFAHIGRMHQGDEIRVVTGQGRFVYQVEDVRRPGDPLPPALAPGGSQLTLMTAQSGGWRSGWAPTGTLYVDATLVQPKTAPASPGFPARVSDEEKGMAPDTSGLTELIFWLQGLLLVAVGMVWAGRHWGPGPTWLVGGGALIGLLWGATNAAVLLLPNLV